jgi:hypothetical protein
VLARAHRGQQVAADLLFDSLEGVPAGPQFAQGRDGRMGGSGSGGVSLIV